MEQVLLLTELYKRGSDNLVSIINLQGIILVKLRSCGESWGSLFKNLIYFIQELAKGFSLDIVLIFTKEAIGKI